MGSRGCRVPPEGRGWGPAKSLYGGGSAGGPAVAWCSGSVVIVTGGTNTAASAAGGKRGGNNGGPPTGGTSKAGHQTDRELYSWGAAHGPLWDALRKKGKQVRVIGIAVQNVIVDRAARVLEAWAQPDPGTPDEGLTVKQEIKAIDHAMTHNDENFLAQYGGFAKAGKRFAELQRRPEAKLTEGVSIDDYSTWRAVRFADPDEIG